MTEKIPRGYDWIIYGVKNQKFSVSLHENLIYLPSTLFLLIKFEIIFKCNSVELFDYFNTLSEGVTMNISFCVTVYVASVILMLTSFQTSDSWSGSWYRTRWRINF
jgi:hypothetical protein